MALSENITDYFLAFSSGVLVSFTPCVYPILPITAAFIAGFNTQGTRWGGFSISLIYVLGLAVTYSILGIVASLTGKVFGQIQNHPLVFILVANVLILFALVMFDVIPLPTWGGGAKNKFKMKNLWAVLLFGMAAGLVIGPCTAPFLGTLLLYIASKQNILHGISLMVLFSFGLGTSLILVGTFSGVLSSLPKSGKWLVRIKQAGGVILLIVAEYLLIKAGEMQIF